MAVCVQYVFQMKYNEQIHKGSLITQACNEILFYKLRIFPHALFYADFRRKNSKKNMMYSFEANKKSSVNYIYMMSF